VFATRASSPVTVSLGSAPHHLPASTPHGEGSRIGKLLALRRGHRQRLGLHGLGYLFPRLPSSDAFSVVSALIQTSSSTSSSWATSFQLVNKRSALFTNNMAKRKSMVTTSGSTNSGICPSSAASARRRVRDSLLPKLTRSCGRTGFPLAIAFSLDILGLDPNTACCTRSSGLFAFRWTGTPVGSGYSHSLYRPSERSTFRIRLTTASSCTYSKPYR